MERRFRALVLVALICKVIAWIVFVLGGLLALFLVVIGAIQGRAGTPSPLVASLPGLSSVSGALSGLLYGVGVLLGSLVQFILLYAACDTVELALAIERNTRETARYLRGENALPPPPAPITWETPAEPADDAD